AGHTTELAAAPAVFASWTYPGPATDKVSVDPAHGTVVVTRGTAPIVLTSTLRVADGTHWQSVLPKLTWDGHAYW
ncbi:MAG: hypothetical protein QOF39_1541, partial [Frankiales bacterium]|nr:hypothetical protein [Frankiales bacterium]